MSSEVYKERELPDKGIQKNNQRREIRARTMIERKKENSVPPSIITSSSGELVKSLL